MDESYRELHSDEAFKRKLTGIPRSAGRKVVEQALTLYLLLTEAGVPVWLRVAVLAALGYLICPVDAIPDFLPGGYLDDLLEMALVVRQAGVHATPDLKARARDMVPECLQGTGTGNDY